MHRLPLAPAFARSARPRSGFVQCPLAVVGEGAWTLTPPPLPGAWPFRLYLRRTAIDKQLDPSHETGIVRRKKKCRRSDLMRLTECHTRGCSGYYCDFSFELLGHVRSPD